MASGLLLPAFLKSVGFQVIFCFSGLISTWIPFWVQPASFAGGRHLVSPPSAHVFPAFSCWSAPPPALTHFPVATFTVQDWVSLCLQLAASLIMVIGWGRFHLHPSWFIHFNLYSHYLVSSLILPILLLVTYVEERYWKYPPGLTWLCGSLQITTTYLKGKWKSEDSGHL